MKIETGRFGELQVGDEKIWFPGGILGFPDRQHFCLVDPNDDTLILWMQSLQDPKLAFPVLEPKIYDPHYVVKLSAAEKRELKLESLRKATVFSILTIPTDVTQMTANMKAPIVVNFAERIAKQVVLQENQLPLKFPIFKELRAHLVTLRNVQKKAATEAQETPSVVALSRLSQSLSLAE